MTYKEILFTTAMTVIFCNGFAQNKPEVKPLIPVQILDSVKKPAVETILNDSLYTLLLKFKPYKKAVHASYYHDKFTGRRTASGEKFNNNKYTAAHRKFPFGTMLRIINEQNGKSVIVKVTDRGPFTRGREIDLTRKAFMEIASEKKGGAMKVNIEVEKEYSNQ